MSNNEGKKIMENFIICPADFNFNFILMVSADMVHYSIITNRRQHLE